MLNQAQKRKYKLDEQNQSCNRESLSPKKRKKSEIKERHTPNNYESKPANKQIQRPKIVMVMGQGDAGQLGLGPNVFEARKPRIVCGLPDSIVDIAAGGMHSLVLTSSGSVYSWGCNDEGALGRSSDIDDDYSQPAQVQIDANIVQISAGDSHSAALCSDGNVFIWGVFRDKNGKIGLINSSIEMLPIQLQTPVKIKCISSGSDHLLMLGCDKKVYAIGCSEQGQRGDVPRDKWLTVLPLFGKNKICVNIWTGYYASFVQVESSHDIIAFGLNNYCQLGINTKDTMVSNGKAIDRVIAGRIKCISCADHHTLSLTSSGFVYTAGRKEYGRLGTGDKSDNKQFRIVRNGLQNRIICQISAGPSVSFAVSRRGLLYSWGMGDNLCTGRSEDVSKPERVVSVSTDYHVEKVAAGGQHCILLLYLRKL
ncbi:hypothetical protein GJ496_009582 [Pomphorhynchus laevis]|nr:hypothetical protein GJ496_009582 [Pomphorhynchus laevis]